MPTINPVTSGSTADPTANSQGNGSATAGIGQVANMNTFLQLLVAQMKNQNPLNPTDGTQFVAQLAQFSELEQMIGVRTDVQGIRSDLDQAMLAARTATNPTQGDNNV